MRLSSRACAATIFIAMSAGASPLAAAVCPPPFSTREPAERPIRVDQDGAFEVASANDEVAYLRGRPVRDIGGGRVGQIIEQGSLCVSEGVGHVSERLLFVDCTTESAIIVDGSVLAHGVLVEDPRRYIDSSTLSLQPPDGPLGLNARTTVTDVARLAAERRWVVETDVQGWTAAMKPQARFDPFFGCHLFYPDSAGARR